jgi:hypothetical protein
MVIKYNANIKSSAANNNLKRLTNQIYKLLPMREENLDWQKPLETVIEELAGMDRLFIDQQEILFSLLCKLEGLFTLTEEKDFLLFRRIIFECLGMMSTLKEICRD